MIIRFVKWGLKILCNDNPTNGHVSSKITVTNYSQMTQTLNVIYWKKKYAANFLLLGLNVGAPNQQHDLIYVYLCPEMNSNEVHLLTVLK